MAAQRRPDESAPRRPKHLWIRADLADRIRRKEFTAGQSLPSQARLSKDYGVTLMTLRQALKSLQDEGVIVQLPGRGTFVTPVPTLNLTLLSSLAEELAAQGITLGTEVLACRIDRMPKDVAASLGRESTESGLRLERLRRIDAKPVVHQVSWVPSPWAGALPEVDFQTESLYRALARRCSVVVASARETLRAQTLPRTTARLGDARAGDPVLIAERITYDTAEAAVVYDIATLLNETMSVVVHRVQRRTELTWVAAAELTGKRD